mmetsp:Transcript_39986/g.71773  ORF Transcript_39986/g.71773 Transcript_39986/m.71773 type:complete len:349 (-) Transcript_39986:249-1295(-)
MHQLLIQRFVQAEQSQLQPHHSPITPFILVPEFLQLLQALGRQDVLRHQRLGQLFAVPTADFRLTSKRVSPTLIVHVGNELRVIALHKSAGLVVECQPDDAHVLRVQVPMHKAKGIPAGRKRRRPEDNLAVKFQIHPLLCCNACSLCSRPHQVPSVVLCPDRREVLLYREIQQLLQHLSPQTGARPLPFAVLVHRVAYLKAAKPKQSRCKPRHNSRRLLQGTHVREGMVHRHCGRGHQRCSPRGGDAQMIHSLAVKKLSDRTAQRLSAIGTPREGRPASALQLQLPPRAVLSHHLSYIHGACVPQLATEDAVLMPTITVRCWLATILKPAPCPKLSELRASHLIRRQT